MIASIIPRAHLAALWPVLWPMLYRAARRAGMTEADVRPVIERGDAELWAILEGGQLIAAITTQITIVPEKRCRIWLVGGSRMSEWAADFLQVVEPWARELGCTMIWGTQSRRGWARIVQLFGGAPIDSADGPAWARRL